MIRSGLLLAAAVAAGLAAPAEANSHAPARSGSQAAPAVIPFPGTPDAAPQSQIIFSELAPAQLTSVTVRGSRTGVDPGLLVVLPDGRGTAFVPHRRFSPGEHVDVSANLRSHAHLRFSFTVAAPVTLAIRESARRGGSARNGPPSQHFRSAPQLHPPLVSVTADPDTTSGDIFVDPGQRGVMVLDAQGQVVWFRPLTGQSDMDVSVQSYHGRSVLTWWQGLEYKHAEDVIVNDHYRTVAAVRAGNGYVSDPHEFQITPQGTALIDVYVPMEENLTAIGGGTHQRVIDCLIQEVDIRTGQVLWEWHAMGHIPLAASYAGRAHPGVWYDPYHLNSIQQLPSGNLLVSFRNTWAVYEISKRTGRVIWSLGGKHSSFKMGRGTNFEWQHDARLHPDGTLSLFDDAGLPQEERQSSAKILRINTRTMKATLVKRYTHTPALLASVAGSTQILPNHNVFVNWGSQGEFTEYSPSGRQLFNGAFPIGVGVYRAFRFPWVGHPLTRPLLALSRTRQGAVKLYVSWNGATQVVAWRVLGGSGPAHLKRLGLPAPRTGFQTVVTSHTTARFFAVQALNARGRVIGTTAGHELP